MVFVKFYFSTNQPQIPCKGLNKYFVLFFLNYFSTSRWHTELIFTLFLLIYNNGPNLISFKVSLYFRFSKFPKCKH